MNVCVRFLLDEDGPTTVEYAIMLALVLAVVLISVDMLGSETSDAYGNSRDQIHDAFAPARAL